MPIYKLDKKNADGKNQYKVRVNYTDIHGNHKAVTRNIYGKSEAKELEKTLMDELKSTPSGADLTLETIYTEYMASIKPEVRFSTYDRKVVIWDNHISPYLKDYTLRELTPKIFTDWKLWMEEKPLALQTKRNVFAQLKSTLNFAVKMEYIEKNPINKIDNFKDSMHQDSEIQFYTPEEFAIYKAAALTRAQQIGNYDYYVFFCIAYYCGFRKGEIHALRWSCYKSGSLSVKKSISQKLKGKDMETPPKNKSSIRTIKVPAPLVQILIEQKKRQKELAKICGIDWTEDLFICGMTKPLRDTSVDNENRANAKNAQLHRIRIHDFRHSHASLLINAGVNALEVAKRLGHSTVDQTLKTYSHLFPTEEEKALNVLNNIK